MVGHATMLADTSRRRILIIGALGKLLKTLGWLESHETQTIIEDLDGLPKLPRGMTKMTLWNFLRKINIKKATSLSLQ